MTRDSLFERQPHEKVPTPEHLFDQANEKPQPTPEHKFDVRPEPEEPTVLALVLASVLIPVAAGFLFRMGVWSLDEIDPDTSTALLWFTLATLIAIGGWIVAWKEATIHPAGRRLLLIVSGLAGIPLGLLFVRDAVSSYALAGQSLPSDLLWITLAPAIAGHATVLYLGTKPLALRWRATAVSLLGAWATSFALAATYMLDTLTAQEEKARFAHERAQEAPWLGVPVLVILLALVARRWRHA